jgi:hypothetical protein
MTAVVDSSAFSALIERRYSKLTHYQQGLCVDFGNAFFYTLSIY